MGSAEATRTARTAGARSSSAMGSWVMVVAVGVGAELAGDVGWGPVGAGGAAATAARSAETREARTAVTCLRTSGEAPRQGWLVAPSALWRR